MAVYRRIHTTFWQDEYILELSPEEKFFYLYLMTNTKTTQSGIYEMPKRVIQFETGLSIGKIDTFIDKFQNDHKIIYDDETSEVMLMNWSRYNYSTSPKVIKCIEKELSIIKSTKLLEIFNSLPTTSEFNLTVDIDYGNSIDTVSIPKRNKNKKKEQGEEERQKKQSIDIPDYLADVFDDFVEMRKTIKEPMTDRAKSMLLNKLYSLSDDEKEQVRIMEHAIVSNWKTVWPINKNKNKTIMKEGTDLIEIEEGVFRIQ